MHIKRAFVFPGQGSQIVGMGKDFFEQFDKAKSVFNIVDDVLQYKLSDIIFAGPIDKLTLTEHTQPALMATSIAIFETIIEQCQQKINKISSFVAGHSLGEYSALCSAGSLSLEDTTKLLRLRAVSMQQACPKGEGAMAACIGINATKLQQLIDSAITDGICQIANDNVDGQIVISGHKKNIDYMLAIMKDTGHKAIKLKVSTPFHSELMQAAKLPMSRALSQIKIKAPIVPLIANVTAQITNDVEEIRSNLVQQICGMVRWRETMDYMAKNGITDIVEIGSGSVLTGLARKSPHNFNIYNISTIKQMDDYLANLC